MKKLKYVLILLCLILVVLIIIIIKNKGKNEAEKTADQALTQADNSYGEEVSFIDYFIVKNCLQQYVSELNMENFIYYHRDENGKYIDDTDETEKKTKYL